MRCVIATAGHTWRWSCRLSFISLMLVALLAATLRLLLPLLADQRLALEQTLSEVANLPIRLEQVEFDWQGWRPILHVRGFSVRDPRDSDSVLLRAETADAIINLPSSLWQGRVLLSRLRLDQLNIELEYGTDGELRLLPQALGRPPLPLEVVAATLVSIRALDIQHSQLQLYAADQRFAPLNVPLTASLRDHGDGYHRLDVITQAPHAYGNGDLRAVFIWHGGIDLEQWRGQFYASADAVPLAAIPQAHDWRGAANVQLWGDWTGQRLQQLWAQLELSAHSSDIPNTTSVSHSASPSASASNTAAVSHSASPSTSASNTAAVSHSASPSASASNTAAVSHSASPSTSASNTATVSHSANASASVSSANSATSVGESDSEPFTAVLHWQAQQGLWDGWLDPGTGQRAQWRAQRIGTRWIVDALGLDIAGLRFTLQNLAPPTLADPLRQLAASAWLDELRLVYDSALEQPWYGNARILGLRWQAYQQLPGFNSLDALLSWGGNQAQIQLLGRQLQLDASALFSKPLPSLRSEGHLTLQALSDGWLLQPDLTLSNADLHTQIQGQIRLDAAPSPWLDLHLYYQNLRVAATQHYLPSKIMDDELVEWLTHALQAGTGRSGQLRVRGRAADFPYDNPQQGEFYADLAVEQARLAYQPDWPAIDQLQAKLRFQGRALLIESEQARLSDAQLTKVAVKIADLERPVLDVQGQARGSLSGMLQFVQDSPPLAHEIGPGLADLRANGAAKLDLGLKIPLDSALNQPLRVNGRLAFNDNQLLIQRWDVQLKDVSGEVRFDEKQAQADNLQLQIAGQPAKLSFKSAGQTTALRLQARLQARELVQMVNPQDKPTIAWSEGRCEWLLEVETAHDPRTPPKLILRSDLHGLSLKAPGTLAKKANEKRPFSLKLEQRAGRWLAELNYANTARAVLELDAKGLPQRGELRLGSGTLRLPDDKQVRLVGSLPSLSLDGGMSAGTTKLDWLDELDIELGELLIGAQRFSPLHIRGQFSNGLAELSFTGPQLTGTLIQEKANRYRVNLQTLALQRPSSSDSRATTRTSPSGWPTLDILIKRLILDGRELGQLRLQVQAQANGVRFDPLELDGPLGQVRASAEWLIGAGQQHTRVNLHWSSDDLARALASLGLPKLVEQAPLELALDISWIGSLPLPDLGSLDGQLHLHLGKGILREIEPGVGRMLGLFSFASLPRRLRLDFSDLVQSGLAFDRIDGTLNFQEGQAYSNDLVLEGPAVRVEIDGRAGLLERDYNQRISVIPKISASIPIAGALAGGPVVGAALLLAERVLQPQIDAVLSYQYQLSGSWDKPQFQPLGTSSTNSGVAAQ